MRESGSQGRPEGTRVTMRRRLATAGACALLVAGVTAVAAQSQDGDDGGGGGGKPVVFDVGDPQGIDSMNPLIGVTVAAYEAWNLQYATLTDKAAEDFSNIDHAQLPKAHRRLPTAARTVVERHLALLSVVETGSAERRVGWPHDPGDRVAP